MAPTVRERELASPWWARNILVQIFSPVSFFHLAVTNISCHQASLGEAITLPEVKQVIRQWTEAYEGRNC